RADLLDKWRENDAFALNRQIAPLATGESPQPGQDGLQMQCDGQYLAIGAGEPRVRELNGQLSKAAELGDRRAELVGDVRAEAALALERFLQSAQEFVE